MKVSTFVNSKKKFLQADVNGDGVSKNIKEAWSKGVTLWLAGEVVGLILLLSVI